MQNQASAIRTVIVEDEISSQNILLHLLKSDFPDIEVVGIAGSVAEALEVIESAQPDLVFLDVSLPDGSGFDILKKVEATDFKVVFVTAFGEYAIKAIKFHALDYLLKPYKKEEFHETILKVKSAILKKGSDKRVNQLLINAQNPDKSDHKIVIPTSTGQEYIQVAEIYSCTSDKKYTTFFLQEKRQIVSSYNIGHYEKLLPGFDEAATLKHVFCRCHHQHLVNLFYVKSYNRIEGHLLLEDGQTIPISLRRKTKVLNFLAQTGIR